MVLGDLFPASEKEKAFQNQFKPGVILYLHCDFTTPPKEKYLLVAADDGEVLCFVINSEINPFLGRRKDSLRCQILLKQHEHNFLAHDSYVNCCELRRFDKDFVRDIVVKDIARIKGQLSETATQDVLNAVSGAKTLSTQEKQLVLTGLPT